MKDLEQYIIATAKERETSERRRHRQRLEYRRWRENQYQNDKAQMTMTITCLVLILVAILASITVSRQTVRAIEPSPIKATVAMPTVVTEEPDTSYRRDDIPLTNELQDLLHVATEENHLPYTLVLAQMWKETRYRNLVGDDGKSLGYLQVQKKWHWDRMARLGVTDLFDPESNFRVACDYLRECIDSTDTTADALTLYNSGHTGKNQYATEVLQKWEELSNGTTQVIK